MNNTIGLVIIILIIGLIVLIVWKGKDLLKMQLIQSSFFKQLGFLFSTPEKAQKIVMVSETGTIGQEILPMHTGFVNSTKTRRTWLVLHALKFLVYKDGKPAQDEPILLISERNYLPLDPNNSLKPKEKEKLASLKDIAKLKHAEARALAGKPNEQNDLTTIIVYGSFILIAIFGIIGLILRKWGGGG